MFLVFLCPCTYKAARATIIYFLEYFFFTVIAARSILGLVLVLIWFLHHEPVGFERLQGGINSAGVLAFSYVFQ